MVGILAGTIYTVAINQLLYIEILEILGMILFFGSPIITLFWVFWVGTGTDSDDTGSIRDNSPSIRHDSSWSSPRTYDCWGSCESPFEKWTEHYFNDLTVNTQERQRELWNEKED